MNLTPALGLFTGIKIFNMIVDILHLLHGIVVSTGRTFSCGVSS